MVIAILFFVIAIVLFFIFDIRAIFNFRTGRAQAKSVKEMEQANAETGHLRSVKKPAASSRKKTPASSFTPPAADPTPAATPAYQPQPAYPENEITPPKGLGEETSLLTPQADTAPGYDPGQGAETELLTSRPDQFAALVEEPKPTAPKPQADSYEEDRSVSGLTERLDTKAPGETTVLGGAIEQEFDQAVSSDSLTEPEDFFFDVIKKIIRRDTDEIIR